MLDATPKKLFVEFFIEVKQLRIHLQNALFEMSWSRSSLGCSVGQLVQRIDPVNIRADQVILLLESILNQVLEFLHLNLHNDLIDTLLIWRKHGQGFAWTRDQAYPLSVDRLLCRKEGDFKIYLLYFKMFGC